MKKLQRSPGLAVIRIGEDPASGVYVVIKKSLFKWGKELCLSSKRKHRSKGNWTINKRIKPW